MSDYDGTINEFKSPIPPALQGIIDKVTSYASKTIGGAHGQTRAQGAALQGVMGVVGGLEEQRRGQAADMAKLGVGNQAAMDLAKMGQTGEIEKQKIASAPGLMEATEKTKPLFDSGSLSPISSSKGIGSSFGGFGAWNNNDQYHKIFGDWT